VADTRIQAKPRRNRDSLQEQALEYARCRTLGVRQDDRIADAGEPR
jgi:hypothetical protein